MKHLIITFILLALSPITDYQLELLCPDSRWPLRVPSVLTSTGIEFTRVDTGDIQCHYRLSLIKKDDANGFVTLGDFLLE